MLLNYKFLTHLKDIIKDYLYQEFSTIYLWLPLAIALGISIFFNFNFDPNIYFSIIFIAFSLTLIYLSREHFIPYKISLLVFAMSIGFFASWVRVELIDTQFLGKELKNVNIIGTIDHITDNSIKRRILLKDVNVEGSSIRYKYIRISTKHKLNDFKVADTIMFKGVLLPPPLPTLPYGFNYAQYAFFKGISAIGYTTGSLTLLDSSAPRWFSVNNVRQYVATKIVNSMDKDGASIVTALIIGDNSQITTANYEAIRKAGIAHIVAISGLHIVIIVSIIFFCVKYILGYFPKILLYYDIRKIGAIFGIIFSFIYLMLAGAPISAQRAFIMSSLVLFAIIIDRPTTALHSVATAAIIILILFPESLFSASLQMSFAACTSLIAAFNTIQKHLKGKSIMGYLLSTIFSTLVATISTTPFVIYHFNQLSTYSILTNLFIIPLTNFIIMPLCIIVILLIPLSLEYIPLTILQFPVDLMLYIAQKVSELPFGSFYIPSYTPYGIALISIGLLCICIMKTHLKWIGLGFIGLSLNMHLSKPDMILHPKLFAVQYNKQYYFSSRVRARFIRKTWEEKLNIKNSYPLSILSSQHIYNNFKNNIESDGLVINEKFKIDNKWLQQHGTTYVWLNKKIKLLSVADTLPNRVWNRVGDFS